MRFLLFLLPVFCQAQTLTIVAPDSLTRYLTEYIDYKSDYSVQVQTYETMPYFLSPVSISGDYILLINAPILYDTIPIPPYWGIMASDHFYGDRVGRVDIANGQELTRVLKKFMDFIPYREILMIGSKLDY